jgi:hypothetical protein
VTPRHPKVTQATPDILTLIVGKIRSLGWHKRSVAVEVHRAESRKAKQRQSKARDETPSLMANSIVTTTPGRRH